MNVRIVLVGARHPGNLGSTARAMKTMGLADLALVAPERYPAPEAVTMAAAADDVLAPVALLFGAERTGLSNDDLEQCHRLLTIPCDEAYASLNLAMAVQVVAYELWLAVREPRGGGGDVAAGPHASAQEMERFYEQLAQVLDEIDFRDRTRSGQLMARLRRFFNRAAPDENEIHILRGILTAVQARRRRAGEPHRAPAAPGT